jgi:hypothetical protein
MHGETPEKIEVAWARPGNQRDGESHAFKNAVFEDGSNVVNNVALCGKKFKPSAVSKARAFGNVSSGRCAVCDKKAKDVDKTAGCEKLPEGGMRDNCEKKVEEGKKDDKKASVAKRANQASKALLLKANVQDLLDAHHGARSSTEDIDEAFHQVLLTCAAYAKSGGNRGAASLLYKAALALDAHDPRVTPKRPWEVLRELDEHSSPHGQRRASRTTFYTTQILESAKELVVASRNSGFPEDEAIAFANLLRRVSMYALRGSRMPPAARAINKALEMLETQASVEKDLGLDPGFRITDAEDDDLYITDPSGRPYDPNR